MLRGEREMTSEMSGVLQTAESKFGEGDDGVSSVCLNAGWGVGTSNNGKKLLKFFKKHNNVK